MGCQTGQVVLGPLEGHTSWVTSVAFSPNGILIVSCSHDNTICMWDARTGRMVLGPLEGHAGPVESVAFSPDSTHVVSCSSDNAIRVWRVPYERPLLDTVSSHFSRSSTLTYPTVPSQNHIPGHSTNASSSWSRDKNGWVRDPHGRLLFWVPPDLRGCLLMPQNTALISAQGSICLHFENAKIGEWWSECYSPA